MPKKLTEFRPIGNGMSQGPARGQSSLPGQPALPARGGSSIPAQSSLFERAGSAKTAANSFLAGLNFQAFFSINPHAMVVLDRKGEIQKCNAAFEALFQYRES